MIMQLKPVFVNIQLTAEIYYIIFLIKSYYIIKTIKTQELQFKLFFKFYSK